MDIEKFIEEKSKGFESWDSFYSGLSIEQETSCDTAKLYEQYLADYIKDSLSELHSELTK